MSKKSLIELRDEMRAVARGARKLSLLPAAPVLAALSQETIDLLGILLRDRPETVSKLVQIAGRAQPNVSRSLQVLETHRLVRLGRVGREVRPEPTASDIRVDLTTGKCEFTPVT